MGEKYHFELKVDVAGLNPGDIGAELVIARQIVGGQSVNVLRTIPFTQTAVENGLVTYTLDYTPGETGTYDFAPLEPAPAPPHGLRAGEVGLRRRSRGRASKQFFDETVARLSFFD